MNIALWERNLDIVFAKVSRDRLMQLTPRWNGILNASHKYAQLKSQAVVSEFVKQH
jgi:hypothetical protein